MHYCTRVRWYRAHRNVDWEFNNLKDDQGLGTTSSQSPKFRSGPLQTPQPPRGRPRKAPRPPGGAPKLPWVSWPLHAHATAANANAPRRPLCCRVFARPAVSFFSPAPALPFWRPCLVCGLLWVYNETRPQRAHKTWGKGHRYHGVAGPGGFLSRYDLEQCQRTHPHCMSLVLASSHCETLFCMLW